MNNYLCKIDVKEIESSCDNRLNQSILTNVNQLMPSHSPLRNHNDTSQSCRPSFEYMKPFKNGGRDDVFQSLNEDKSHRFY